MDIYRISRFRDVTEGNRYPGRGIVVGETCDGTNAVIAYFIMGRSANSRNRIFVEKDGAVFTEPYDASKLEDPSLIIYAAVRECGKRLIVTNGDQTDTVFEAVTTGKPFHEALTARSFEPDAPNLTPRISAVLDFGGAACSAEAEDSAGNADPGEAEYNGGAPGFRYSISILKSENAEGAACARYFYDYTPLPGLGHFIHTYECDGSPLPTFQGEPRRIVIPDSIDEFTDEIWSALDQENKISLYVRYTGLGTGRTESRLVNKYE